MIDEGKQRRDVLSGPWPNQQPRYADAKESLHGSLREVREELLGKLEGLGEYDIRRPLTATGTNLPPTLEAGRPHRTRCSPCTDSAV